jgi:AcrR family transcriptional regulator
MGRPPGSRSDDYEEKRSALAHSVYKALIEDAHVSFSGMAERAGVSRPTMAHYFGDRNGAVQAALSAAAHDGRRFHGLIVSMNTDHPEHTLSLLLTLIIAGWRDHGVGNLHGVGIQAGLADTETAHCYLGEILDPLTESVQHLLERMIQEGHLRHAQPRQGALQLLGPVVVALLHQNGLKGRLTAPLDEEALARETARGFLAAYGTARIGA